jgi:hypothetical protein
MNCSGQERLNDLANGLVNSLANGLVNSVAGSELRLRYAILWYEILFATLFTIYYLLSTICSIIVRSVLLRFVRAFFRRCLGRRWFRLTC